MNAVLIRAVRRVVSGCGAAALVVVLAACGGGGGGGMDTAGVGTGGTGTVSSPVTVGSISGFGSVIVAGVRFDDSAAKVTDEDGGLRARGDLKLGMVAEIGGSADFTARTGVAATIRYGSEIVGPVGTVDVAGGRFTVLGATVKLTAATVFDDGLAGLAALRAGQRVEIYGFYNAAAGAYTATRIEAAPLATRFRLRGPVEALDATGRSFTVGGVRIDYAGVPLAALPVLANGAIVRVAATVLPSGGVWTVDAVAGAARSAPSGGEFKVEGNITAMLSATAFVVDGVTVDAAGASVSGTLAVGRRVEAEGHMSGGVLVAAEVESSDEDVVSAEAFEITALIDSFDPLTRRFRLHGQLIDASGAASYENGTAADLANGRRIELKGYFDAASGAVVATRIHFED